jgi:transcriptional regulator with XRE-family HTH domain
VSTGPLVAISGFGERLKAERNRLRLTQETFATGANTNRASQGFYEKEQNWPTIEYLAAVSAMGVDVTYLLYGYRADQLALQIIQSEVLTDAFQLVGDLEKEFGAQLAPKTRAKLFQLVLGAFLSGRKDAKNLQEVRSIIGA